MNSPAGRITRALRIQAACDFHRAQVVAAVEFGMRGARYAARSGWLRSSEQPIERSPAAPCLPRIENKLRSVLAAYNARHIAIIRRSREILKSGSDPNQPNSKIGV